MDNISLMFVDDNQLVLDGMAMFLESEGFDVSAFTSTDAALEAIAADRFDICITDLQMPGMRGDQFVLAAYKESPTTQYMIFTGSEYEIPQELAVLGLTQANVLQKPVLDMSGLAKRIIDLIEGRVVN